MTCIIGGKCKDGVAIIADKKIVDPETRLVEFKDKLFIFRKDNFYYPIVIGSSGTVPLYDKFKKEAIAELEKIKPNLISFTSNSFTTTSFNVSGMIYPYASMNDNAKEVILDPYLEKLEKIIKKYKGDYSNDHFDVLFGAQVQQKGAILVYIAKDGLSEDIDKHKVIGSSEIPANVFLKAINPNDMSMDEFAKWVIS